VPSRYESTREPRELLVNSTFLGDSAPKEREETSSRTSSTALTRTCVMQAKRCAPQGYGGWSEYA
jgi:hypothetical protein